MADALAEHFMVSDVSNMNFFAKKEGLNVGEGELDRSISEVSH